MGIETNRGSKASQRQQPQIETKFVPEINQTSRLLAQHRNCNIELTKQTPKALKKTQLEYLEGKLTEYTFQPTVNQNYSHVTQPPVSHKEVRALDY